MSEAIRGELHPKQLKNQKRRQKQSELKQARKLELLELRKQLEQDKGLAAKTRHIGTYLIYASAILFGLAEIAISLINGYMQANDDIPALIALCNKYLPVVRNLGGVLAMLGAPSIGGRIGWSIYVVLFGVSLL